MDNVIKELNKYLYNLNTVVIACSGGPDSMLLMHLLIKYRLTHELNIICAHVNHNVRVESDAELEFVKSFCLENNIVFESIKLNEKDKSESNLRNKRYEFLETIINKYNSKLLLTAHHGDDLIETVLMRMVRGSNLNGYGGFRILTHNKFYDLLRPLIYLTKDEVLKYCDKFNIKYVIDKSNFSLDYTRNRYRINIIPELKKENPKLNEKILEFSRELYECNSIIDDLVNDYFEKYYIDNKLELTNFYDNKEIIKRKIVEKYLSNIYDGCLNLITGKHVNLILELLNNRGNSKISLPSNKVLIKEYNKLFILDNNNYEDYEYILKDKCILPNNKIMEIVLETSDTSNYCVRLNSKEILMPLKIRNKRSGDLIEVKNLNGRKKVKEIFIDSKIAKNDRKVYPILTDSNDSILWIPGLKKSKFDKKIDEKYDIIIKYH